MNVQNSLKNLWIYFLIFVGFIYAAHGQIVISEKTDNSFGGYYIDVDKTIAQVQVRSGIMVPISSVMIAQKKLRDCLQLKSQSFFRVRQAPYLEACGREAQAPLNLSKGVPQRRIPTPIQGLIVVFDLDETLLTEWHRISRDFPNRTTFVLKNTDLTLSEKDQKIIWGPVGVTVRPGALQMLQNLAMMPSVNTIYFFTAKEDDAATEVTRYFLNNVPALKNKFKGVLTRNYLRFDGDLTKPSKDLRIISPDLKNIVIIDDNPTRIMQKELNFTMPKFNADLYLDAVAGNRKDVVDANNAIIPFIQNLLTKLSQSRQVATDFYPYSTARAEKDNINWGREILRVAGFSNMTIDTLLQMKIFDQEFVIGPQNPPMIGTAKLGL